MTLSLSEIESCWTCQKGNLVRGIIVLLRQRCTPNFATYVLTYMLPTGVAKVAGGSTRHPRQISLPPINPDLPGWTSLPRDK